MALTRVRTLPFVGMLGALVVIASPAPSAERLPDLTAPPETAGDTWIFSGVLPDTSETFSGTLVTNPSNVEFELKLAGGATCDGNDLTPSLGLVKLSEVTCSDGRPLSALFVPQPQQTLKVFGHVGGARFTAVAHILGMEAIPEPPQTTAPHAPAPPPPDGSPPASRPPHAPSADDPG